MVIAADPKPRATTPQPAPAPAPPHLPAPEPPISEELRAWLLDYIAHADGMTRNRLGKMLGYTDGTAVSRYINRKPEGDVGLFERRVRDLRRRAEAEAVHQLADAAEFFPTSVSAQVAIHLGQFRAAKMLGVIHSEAGLGKTRAVEHYAATHENTWLVTANARRRDARGLMQGIWPQISHRGYQANSARYDYVEARFKGSGALVIIDNAQRLVRDGLDFVCDFHDATGCPVALVGDATTLDNLAKVATHFSRANQVREPRLTSVPAAAKKIVTQYLPEHAEALADGAAEVAARPGHLRVLVKCLMATTALLEMDAYRGNPEKAFEASRASSLEVALSAKGQKEGRKEGRKAGR